jgi:putative two-component system response regulator
LEGEHIPKIARLLGIVDFFDAVTSPRPHRPALTVRSSIQMMEKMAGEIFDPDFFHALVDLYKDQGKEVP